MSQKTQTTTIHATGLTSFKKEYQIDVIDHHFVSDWMRELAQKDIDGFYRLIGNNVKIFKEIFGKPDWVADGKKGWTHGWSVYENNMNWIIFTGNKGTYFRIKTPVAGKSWLEDPRVGIGITNFLEKLLEKITY